MIKVGIERKLKQLRNFIGNLMLAAVAIT